MINFPSGQASRQPRETSSEISHATGAQEDAWRLLDKCGQPFMLAAPDGALVYANRAAHLAFGYEWKGNTTVVAKKAQNADKEITGQNWLLWVHPEQKASLLETLERLRSHPESNASIDLRLRYAGGNALVVSNVAWRWFAVTITNLLDENNTWMVQARDISVQREGEESLLRSAIHFTEMQRLANLGYWEWEWDTGKVQWSEEIFHIFGLHPGETEVTYGLIESFIHSDDRGGARLAAETAVSERKILDHHYRIERPSGAIRTIHVRARPVIGAAGRVTHLSGIAQDVTETMQSEQDLRASEARFRRIADSNIIGIMSWDANGEITEANDAFLRIVGYTRSDLWEGLVHPEALTPPEFHDADARAVQQLAHQGTCVPYEKEYIRKDGTRVPVLIGAAYLEAGVGGDLGICFVLDMSAAQAAKTALRESEARYRDLVQTSPDAILVHAEGRILFANEAVIRLVGASSSGELIGRHMLDFVDPIDRDRIAERLQRLWHSEGHNELLDDGADKRIAGPALAHVLRLDGRSVEVEATSSRMLYQGRPAIQSQLRDVTQRGNTARELRRAEEQLRMLIENLPDVIAILDRQGALLYVSSKIQDLTGYAPAVFAGEQVWDYIHEDDAGPVLVFLQEILQAPTNAPWRSMEYRLRHKNGSWRVLEITGKILPPGSLYDGILVAIRDITAS